MGILTDNYHIIKELGRGGMGAVYLATDKRLDRKVAIKMLQLNTAYNIEQTSEIISRFQKEARAVAKLAHPNIVGIHDIGEDNSQYYMVMEFLEGRSIGNLLEEQGSLPIDQCIDLSIQMCKALTYIHANSIVHRDIKPDNIVISSDNIAKLTDFGIAQNEADQMRLTQDGAILGSIMYISPEQLRNSKDVDNRADIYSYGATLYQMLTGQLPFNGETVGEVVAKVLGEKPELPRKLNPSIPFELEAIVMKAMNKDRDKRYKSMEDMERDLNNLRATHSFKKQTVSTTLGDKPASQTGNINKTVAGKSTIYSNQVNTPRPPVVVIEKANTGEKIIRTLIKLLTAIIMVYLTFSFFSGIVAPDIAAQVASSPEFQAAVIQGPYSQSIVESKVGTKATLYCMLLVLAMLGFTAYSFPIEAKGIDRNYNLKAEILPALIVLVISGLFTYFFIARVDTMKKHAEAYNKDVISEIGDFNNILKQKGLLSYSEIVDFKRKYSYLLQRKERKSNIYEEASVQLKNIISDGDYTKPNYIANVTNNDPVSILINDLMTNVFAFSEPIKDLYLPKTNQIASLVSNGVVTAIPPEAVYKAEKDPATAKVKSITFEWQNEEVKNKLLINPNSVLLDIDKTRYAYPKSSEKIVDFTVQNATDKPFLFLLYSVKDNNMQKNIVIEPRQNEVVSVKEGSGFQAIFLFKEKAAIPQSGTYFFQTGDIIKIDKIYYETNRYYSVSEKNFADSSLNRNYTKLDLKSQDVFMTKDADIVSFNLAMPRKR